MVNSKQLLVDTEDQEIFRIPDNFLEDLIALSGQLVISLESLVIINQ